MIGLQQKLNLPKRRERLDDFTKDTLALFTEKMQGHMERWEYAPAAFANDPAGGGEYWADLVKNPGQYYLTEGDTQAIHWALAQNDFKEIVSDVETVMELGPGSHEAILKKTVPFLQSCRSLTSYVAIDATVEQAADAAATVHENLGVKTVLHAQNYMNSPLTVTGSGKTAIVMWGSSVGNVDGFANENPFLKLVSAFEKFGYGMKTGDLMILCFDAESDEQRILNSYSEPSLRAQILSVVHLMKRDGYVTGKFDPSLWRHEAKWFPKVGQCAHMIYPLFDQTLKIAGLTIRIPAWKRFVSNNSYKFSPVAVKGAAKCAGLTTKACFQNGPIALLVAEKV